MAQTCETGSKTFDSRNKIFLETVNPQVSVVIPFYAAPEWRTHVQFSLGLCLAPLLNSSPIKEIILVDDGSTVHVEIPKHPKISQIIFQKNQGVANARNAGIRRSSGEYVLILDSDIILSQSDIYEFVNDLETRPEFSFATFNYLTSFFGNTWAKCQAEYWVNNEQRKDKNWIGVGCCLARRNVFQKLLFKGSDDDTIFSRNARKLGFKTIVSDVHPQHIFNPSLKSAISHWVRGGVRKRDTSTPLEMARGIMVSPLFGIKLAIKFRNPSHVLSSFLQNVYCFKGYVSKVKQKL
jgi:glycosyltransferase involved in cell wall biosynthesis